MGIALQEVKRSFVGMAFTGVSSHPMPVIGSGRRFIRIDCSAL
ncbi:hypothetical protein [Sinorhizobium sp. BG8]|nr:hypothetical protein [Sinorhizobium sp. BG8]